MPAAQHWAGGDRNPSCYGTIAMCVPSAPAKQPQVKKQ
jgi:hypothetical protein